jgi:hypothetical protein
VAFGTPIQPLPPLITRSRFRAGISGADSDLIRRAAQRQVGEIRAAPASPLIVAPRAIGRTDVAVGRASDCGEGHASGSGAGALPGEAAAPS